MNKGTPTDELATFVRVIDLGSFAAAAADRGLTASAVSKIVSRLEDRLGVRLIERTTRRLALTPEGETLLARGRDIVAAVAAAEAEVMAARGRPRGLVRVTTGTAFAKHRLVPLLPDFHALYPEIALDLAVADRRVDIIGEQIDVAIRTGPLGDSSLIARTLATSTRVVCAAPAYLARHGAPVVPAELAAHICLRLTGYARLAEWPMRIDGRIVPLKVSGAITCDSADVLRDMVLAGLGIARLAAFMIEDDLAAGRLVPLLVDHHVPEPVPITALMPPGRQSLPRVRALVDFLAARLAVRD
ncbi:LysR family transcriptional regulator [Prosthecomicrobium hirschii]|uniref:LysR family transcriptional regulator n=1 Tax=Prosthecodimorpha hirschii TaxID=665126 RepID=UPI00221E3C68|nr:LysR family transcriptional regulator [Prosthecomicrobium hirschii]MCW1843974.1 LysR family transcriptional regulator [Prosthecomicrobium hirschii]